MDPPLLLPYHAPFPPVWQTPPLPAPTCNVQTAPAFNTMLSQNDSVFLVNQPPLLLPPMFDASRPPPPLPRQPNNGATKRKLDSKVGPSKLRKPDEPNADKSCEQCAQKHISIDIFKQQIQKLKCEEEYQLVLYKMRLEKYEKEKQVLKSYVGPEFYQILEDYIEGGPPQANGIFDQLTQDNLVSDGSNTLPKQLLLHFFMEYMLNDWRTSVSSSSELQSRRTDSHGFSFSSELNQTFPEMLRTPERSQSIKSLLNETQNIGETRNISRSLTINGFNRFRNEQKFERFAATSTANPVRSSNATSNYQGACMPDSRLLAFSTPQTPKPKQYSMYSSGVAPQSNEQYYSPQYNSSPLNAPVPYNVRAQFSTFSTPQYPMKTPSSSAASTLQHNAQIYNHFAGTRYLQPPNCYP